MRQAADPRHALGQYHRRPRPQALEPLFHAAMLEEQARLVMQNRLADVIEQELGRFHDIGADRAKRQFLDIGDRPGDLRDKTPVLIDRHRRIRRIIGMHRRQDRLGAFAQYQPMRLGMAGEVETEQVG